jgi:hypothetical protein
MVTLSYAGFLGTRCDFVLVWRSGSWQEPQRSLTSISTRAERVTSVVRSLDELHTTSV